MRVLLIKNGEYATEENRFGRRSWREMPSFLPMIATFLEKNGVELEAKNAFRKDHISFDNKDIVVGLISIADGLYEGLALLKMAKQRGCITVLMLFDAWSGMQRQVMEDYHFIDFAIEGIERELVLLELLARISSGTETAGIPGLLARKGKGLRDSSAYTPVRTDMEHMGSSRKWLEKFGPQRYARFYIVASRGCPFNCSFCHVSKRPPSFRKPEDVLDELLLVPDGATVQISSANIVQRPNWARTFSDALIRSGKKISWFTNVRSEMVKDPGLLKLMKRSGCKELLMGVESLAPEILKAVNKKAGLEDIEKAVELILAARIRPTFAMMIGHPLDSDKTLALTYEKMSHYLKKGVHLNGFQYLRPLPGTEIEKECLAAGLLQAPLTYKDFFKSLNEPSCPTRFLSKERLIEWKTKLDSLSALNKPCREPVGSKIMRKGISAAKMARRMGRSLQRTLSSSPAKQLRTISLSPYGTDFYRYALELWQARPNARFVTSEEFYGEKTSPASSNILLRHDLDYLPKSLSGLIDVEKELNLRSDIYVIVDPAHYDLAPLAPSLRKLKDEGFVIGLHTLAPGCDDFCMKFMEELENFEKSLGFPARYFTIHGKNPHPPKWDEERTKFLDWARSIGPLLGIEGSHNLKSPSKWIEDSGAEGSSFASLDEGFLQIPGVKKGVTVGVLTHPDHWVKQEVPWTTSYPETKRYLDRIFEKLYAKEKD